MDKLKKCPSCGGEGRIRSYRTYDSAHHCTIAKYYANCRNCGLSIPDLGYATREQAIREWNER